jgi:SAM-dependent methyltransferase
MDALETITACDLCGGSDFRPRAVYTDYLNFGPETFSLLRCQRCGLCFISPRPTRAAIARYYPDDYEAHAGEVAAPLRRWQARAGGEREPRALERRWLALLQDVSWYVIPRPRGQRRILDLGGGSGKLLDAMRQLGWSTFAVEPSAAAAARARGKGHEVVVGPAEEMCYPAGAFDVVYLWHVLEHTHAPSRVLANARSYLAPGGRLHLAVPNFASLQARLFGQYWWSTDAPRHLYQLTAPTLEAYLRRAGFSRIAMTTRTGATSWFRALRHTVNGVLGTRFRRDPAWAVGMCEILVVASSLVRFFGVGSELRVEAE